MSDVVVGILLIILGVGLLFTSYFWYDRAKWAKAYLYAVKHQGLEDTLDERKNLEKKYPEV